MSQLSAQQVRALDPYAFLAVLGKWVIHPGGRESTERLLEWARLMTRSTYLRKMAWLLPRMSRAVPYLGYVLVDAHKPLLTSDPQPAERGR